MCDQAQHLKHWQLHPTLLRFFAQKQSVRQKALRAQPAPPGVRNAEGISIQASPNTRITACQPVRLPSSAQHHSQLKVFAFREFLALQVLATKRSCAVLRSSRAPEQRAVLQLHVPYGTVSSQWPRLDSLAARRTQVRHFQLGQRRSPQQCAAEACWVASKQQATVEADETQARC